VNDEELQSPLPVQYLSLAILPLVLGFVCVCCIGLTGIFLISDSGMATAWAVSVESGSWDTAGMFVCEDAADQTTFFQNEAVTFADLTVEENDDELRIRGTITHDGETRDWQAVLVTADGGTFGRCISDIQTIEVSENNSDA
jgi:hypothetical protein